MLDYNKYASYNSIKIGHTRNWPSCWASERKQFNNLYNYTQLRVCVWVAPPDAVAL